MNKNRIVILGFGSLLWNSNGLNISNWQKDGPILPLEFSRISKRGNLTLVIDPKNGSFNQVYWTLNKSNNLQDVMRELQKREKIKNKYLNKSIGILDVKNHLYNEGANKYPIIILDGIFKWARKKEIDFVIFSSLSVRFKDVINVPYTIENAVIYFNDLPINIQSLTKNYIEKTTWINTEFKRLFNILVINK